ncbi:MAG: aminopeptidase N, partial [Herbaspirillum sp.]
DYSGIESVVGHEYFHNWTGDRVTCRDWFQLSLKEGLTVFRDQEFSADMVGTESGRAVKRIHDVRVLRQAQFPEDAGPMAHPVRPDSYVEINNFYTVTVYEKGAEVVRMYQPLLGRDGFRKGMDLYFQRHDGHAVACDDFRAAMADANGRDLTQFERWYSQAGTPSVVVVDRYDETLHTYELLMAQTCPPTPGQPTKLALHIPIAVGLLDSSGRDMPLELEGAASNESSANEKPTTMVLELTQAQQTFCFVNVMEKPVPSLLRNFSAPITLDFNCSDDELAFRIAHDSDPFNRWEAGQRLALRSLRALTRNLDLLADAEGVAVGALVDAWRASLNDSSLDPSFREVVLTLPSETLLAEQVEVIDPQAIHTAREFLRHTLAVALRADFEREYAANQTPGAYQAGGVPAARRALKNCALTYLGEVDDAPAHALAQTQYTNANNMTDRLAALTVLVNSQAPQRAAALAQFYTDFKHEALVVDKWFALQATARDASVASVRALMRHPAFTLHNPNRARSLIFSFCNGNPNAFHALDGSGYQFWAEQVIALDVDAGNPQVAARLARSLDRWSKFTPRLRDQMYAALTKVAVTPRLSKDVHEVVGKALAV